MSISLSKGQTISLSKEAPGLSAIHVGLGWDAAKKKGLFGMGGTVDIDLDASIILVDGSKRVVDYVYFRQLRSQDGSIQHSGDNLTGEGEGDDEVIKVDLTRVPGDVKHLFVTVNSYRGQTFDEVDNAFCRILDDKSKKELCRFELREKGRNTGVIMAVISRGANGWDVKALGAVANGRTAQELVAPALNLI